MIIIIVKLLLLLIIIIKKGKTGDAQYICSPPAD